jgi:L-seryl-tRNA(Ser) seleniumtransferase
LGDRFAVSIQTCTGQIGSGSLPVESLESVALTITPIVKGGGKGGGKSGGGALKRLATAFRALPVPVIGRIGGDALHLDLRCLEDEAAWQAQLPQLQVK